MKTLSPRNLTYKVRNGDTLWKIAGEQYEDPLQWKSIAQANRISNPRRLLAGMTLKLSPILSGGDTATKPSTDQRKVIPPPDASYSAKPVLFPSFKVTSSEALSNLDVGIRGSTCRMDLSFDLVATRKGTIDTIEISNTGIDFTAYQKDVKHKFIKVLSEAKIKYDPTARPLGGFAVDLGTTATLTDGKGNELLVTSVSGIPGKTVRYECKAPNVKIVSGEIEFNGEFELVIECSNDDNDDEDEKQSSLVPVAIPATWNDPQPLVVVGEVLLIGAVVTLIVLAAPAAAAAAAGATGFVEAAGLFGTVAAVAL